MVKACDEAKVRLFVVKQRMLIRKLQLMKSADQSGVDQVVGELGAQPVKAPSRAKRILRSVAGHLARLGS